MKIKVYLDILLCNHFIMNLTVLFVYCTYQRQSVRVRRLLSLAVMLALIDLITQLMPVASTGLHVGVLIAEGLLCSKMVRGQLKRKNLLYDILVFIGINALLEGMLTFLTELIRKPIQQMKLWEIILYLALFAIASTVFAGYCYRKHRIECHMYMVTFFRQGESIEGIGFMDTGNHLIGPGGQGNVVVASFTKMMPILPKSVINYLAGVSVWQTDEEADEPFSLIPSHSVGGERMLPALKMDRMVLKQRGMEASYEMVWVAVITGRLSEQMKYDFLLCEEYEMT